MMTATEQISRWAKVWRLTKQAVVRLPAFLKFAISCTLSVGGYDYYHHRYSSIEPLVQAMAVRVESRIEQAERRLEKLHTDHGQKLGLVDDGLRDQRADVRQLQTDLRDFTEEATGDLKTLAANHRKMRHDLGTEHTQVERRLGEVNASVVATHRVALAAEKNTNNFRLKLNGLPGKVLAHDQRLIAFLDDQPFEQLRREVLAATAEVSRSPDLVVLRGGETKQVDFKVLQYDQGKGQYGLRDYRLRFAVEQTASPCGVRIKVEAENGPPEILTDFCENTSRELAHVPLTATLMYVKNNFMHKDLIVLAVVADSRAEPPGKNSPPVRRASASDVGPANTLLCRLDAAISLTSRKQP